VTQTVAQKDDQMVILLADLKAHQSVYPTVGRWAHQMARQKADWWGHLKAVRWVGKMADWVDQTAGQWVEQSVLL